MISGSAVVEVDELDYFEIALNDNQSVRRHWQKNGTSLSGFSVHCASYALGCASFALLR